MDRKQMRREMRLLQQQGVWLQKALFALRKAEVSHDKVLAVRGEEDNDVAYELPLGEGRISLEELEEGLESRIEKLLQQTREMRRSLMA